MEKGMVAALEEVEKARSWTSRMLARNASGDVRVNRATITRYTQSMQSRPRMTVAA